MAYKILVVDDESHYADMLRDLLLQSNFIADMVHSVQQALDAIDGDEYALIIADFKMPGMDGAEFLQRVRQHNLTIPFFMVSGLMNTHELIRVANLGATLVFEKPLEITDFMESVKRYVSPLSDAEFQKKFRGDLTSERYPSELIHLSDKSPLSHEFVQRLWNNFSHERIAIIPVTQGAEVELIAKEISHWKGRSNAEFYTLTPDILADPDSTDALNQVVNDHTISNVLIINGIESASEAHQKVLNEFIRGRHTMPLLHQELFFIILPEVPANGGNYNYSNKELGSIIKSKKIALAPLRERPADVAKYIRRTLANQGEKQDAPLHGWLDSATVGLLLQHHWNGEYDELMRTLKNLTQLKRTLPLSAPELACMLEGVSEVPEQGYTLKSRLLMAQEKCIETGIKANGGDRLSALLTLGVTTEIAESLRQGEIAYPELLK